LQCQIPAATCREKASKEEIATKAETPGARWQKTACILCSLNCGIEVQVGGPGGRHLLRIKGDRDHPVSRGYFCEKAQRLDFYQTGGDRLDAPLRRRSDGTFEAIDWDTAIREVAARFTEVKTRGAGTMSSTTTAAADRGIISVALTVRLPWPRTSTATGRTRSRRRRRASSG